MTVKDSQVTIISTVTAEHIGTNGTAQIFDTRSPAEVILFKPQTRVSSVSLTDTLSELFWMVFHIFVVKVFFSSTSNTDELRRFFVSSSCLKI